MASYARCVWARVPAAARAYRSKPELAAALVDHVLGQGLGQGLVRADWVGGDAAYGNSPALRQVLQARAQAYVLDAGPGLHLCLAGHRPGLVGPGSALTPSPATGHGPGPAGTGGPGAGHRLGVGGLLAGPRGAAGAPGRAAAGLALGNRPRARRGGAGTAPAYFPRTGRYAGQVQPLLLPTRGPGAAGWAGAVSADAALRD